MRIGHLAQDSSQPRTTQLQRVQQLIAAARHKLPVLKACPHRLAGKDTGNTGDKDHERDKERNIKPVPEGKVRMMFQTNSSHCMVNRVIKDSEYKYQWQGHKAR